MNYFEPGLLATNTSVIHLSPSVKLIRQSMNGIQFSRRSCEVIKAQTLVRIKAQQSQYQVQYQVSVT